MDDPKQQPACGTGTCGGVYVDNRPEVWDLVEDIPARARLRRHRETCVLVLEVYVTCVDVLFTHDVTDDQKVQDLFDELRNQP